MSFAIAVGAPRRSRSSGTRTAACPAWPRRDAFVQGLVDNAGWARDRAEEHFNQFAPMFEIGDAAEFVVGEARRLNTAIRRSSSPR